MDIAALMADPPTVHDHQDAPGGVWATTKECYEFIRDHTSPGQHTIETGCGVSTAVFAATGSVHTAVFHDPREGEVLTEWAAARSVDLSNVRLVVGGSDDVLPTLDLPELDLVLIDGGHGFPLPIIDWYYTCRHLKRDGLLVVDDCHLPSVQRLCEFLDHDERWQPLVHGKWRAWRRLSAGPLVEEWDRQGFLPPVRASDVTLISTARERLRPARRVAATLRRR